MSNQAATSVPPSIPSPLHPPMENQSLDTEPLGAATLLLPGPEICIRVISALSQTPEGSLLDSWPEAGNGNSAGYGQGFFSFCIPVPEEVLIRRWKGKYSSCLSRGHAVQSTQGTLICIFLRHRFPYQSRRGRSVKGPFPACL